MLSPLLLQRCNIALHVVALLEIGWRTHMEFQNQCLTDCICFLSVSESRSVL